MRLLKEMVKKPTIVFLFLSRCMEKKSYQCFGSAFNNKYNKCKNYYF